MKSTKNHLFWTLAHRYTCPHTLGQLEKGQHTRTGPLNHEFTSRYSWYSSWTWWSPDRAGGWRKGRCGTTQATDAAREQLVSLCSRASSWARRLLVFSRLRTGPLRDLSSPSAPDPVPALLSHSEKAAWTACCFMISLCLGKQE